MTIGNLLKRCYEEAACSLCRRHFKDPVTVDCGHNFCQSCITQCLEKAEEGPSCPQCKQTVSERNFRLNDQLANLVELIKKVQLEKQEEEKWGVCGKHQEPLKLFCKEHQMCVCVVCDKSKEHKAHNVLPLEEAFQEYKEEMENQMASLEKKKKKLQDLHSDEEQKSRKSLTLLEEERQKGLSAFETLERNKFFWLSQLDDLGKKMTENWDENAVQLLNQITNLSSQIAEMKEKCQLPAGEFLQDIPKRLHRANSPVDIMVLKSSQELESALTAFTYKRKAFEKIFRDFQDSFEKAMQEVHVTLDQETAHPRLSVSENQRSVTGGEKSPSLPSNPERFNFMSCVLGCEKFSAGRHYWDVEIKKNLTGLVVGIARESVKRKGYIKFSPEEGVWGVQYLHNWNKSHFLLSALTSPSKTKLSSPEQLTKIRVFLDYEADYVEFSDPCSGRTIFTFSPACFAGKRLCPIFQVHYGTSLNCC